MAEIKLCSVEDCGKPSKKKGLCSAHYQRLWKHGDPCGGSTPHGELMRFIEDVALKYTGDECLQWPFGGTARGYGVVRVDGRYRLVHRYICEVVHGEPQTPDHDAAPSCGKGHEGCIAPGHLSWKTHAENMSDMLIHGTSNRGGRNPTSKLTEDKVREIRRLNGTMLKKEIGLMFGVSASTISEIHARKKWSWLE